MRSNTSHIFALASTLLFATALQAQPILDALSAPQNLDARIIGQPNADDYGATPFGQGNFLFSSNRNAFAFAPKDPTTNEPLPQLYLLSKKDFSVKPFDGGSAINDLKYYVGPGALLPDSSGIILNHSRQKPDANGSVGMTLTLFSFGGEAPKELSFVEPGANYFHPYFDQESYTLYFASDAGPGKDLDLYESTYSFDGVWSEPLPLAYLNSGGNEVFPTVLSAETLAFSRVTKNYGMQLYTWSLGDTAATLFDKNGRGDDFSLVLVNDTTAMFSQSKRKGQPANLITLTIPTIPTSEVASTSSTEESEGTSDSASSSGDISSSSDSEESNAPSSGGSSTSEGQRRRTVGEQLATDDAASGVPANRSTTPSSRGNSANSVNSWVTDQSAAPGTTRGFSIIVGGFMNRTNAQDYLEDISGWAPQAFIAPYNNKFYVVHSAHQTRGEADRVKANVANRGYRAWILSRGLVAK